MYFSALMPYWPWAHGAETAGRALLIYALPSACGDINMHRCEWYTEYC